MKKTTNTPAVGIVPDGTYPLSAFRDITGISETRMRLARRDGVDLKTLKLGKRKLVKGSDAIEYIDALGRLYEKKTS